MFKCKTSSSQQEEAHRRKEALIKEDLPCLKQEENPRKIAENTNKDKGIWIKITP